MLDEAGTGLLRPASEANLELAQQAGFPADLIEFYRLYEPYSEEGYISGNGQGNRIWDIPNALFSIKTDVPSLVVYPLGYIAFAETRCGDAYCIDKNVTGPGGEHPIVLFSHESVGEDTEPAYIGASRLEVASSIEDFLLKFAALTLIDEPSFPSLPLG
jgi:hypothetical protein